MPPDPNNAIEFSQNQVDRAVQEAIAREQARYKTETLEGRLGELSKAATALSDKVDRNHEGVLKKLDEVNHFKEFVNKRLQETDDKIRVGFDAAELQLQTLMASHMASPQHTLMIDHMTAVAPVEKILKSVPERELALLPEQLHRLSITEENKTKRNFFAKQLEIRAGAAYAILGISTVVAPALIWLVSHLAFH